ncbi:hypothetical protein ACE4Z5_25340, partial [Salmonella enterica]|uniref:hypothetical protein n=1 Tax=Salmonella enterica TaxID=28901 RepID=UPI003D29FA75
MNAGNFGGAAFPNGFTASFTAANPNGNNGSCCNAILEKRSSSASNSFAILKIPTSSDLFLEVSGGSSHYLTSGLPLNTGFVG